MLGLHMSDLKSGCLKLKSGENKMHKKQADTEYFLVLIITLWKDKIACSNSLA